jgi:acyl-coenzyme A synthetase/AMP-(fatty) acid ligase
MSYLDSEEHFRQCIEDSYARVVIAEEKVLEPVRSALSGMRRAPLLVVANGRAEGAIALDDLLAEHPGELAPADTHRDDVAFWLFTAGSTGPPKASCTSSTTSPSPAQPTPGRSSRSPRRTSRSPPRSSIYHAYGLGNGLSFPYSVGATSVLMPGRPDPARILEIVERERAALFFSVTLYGLMPALPDPARYDLGSVRMCCSAAEPLAPDLLRRWQQTFHLEIIDGIGSTELLCHYCCNRPGDVHAGSSGRPVPGYELRLLDDDGRPVHQGEVGNLQVKGDSALAYYWHQHERTKHAIQGECSPRVTATARRRTASTSTPGGPTT